jgi:hypothetical protein
MADLDVPSTRNGSPWDDQIVAVVNEVLEEERGSVLALVQLAAMATDALERHALVVTGGQASQACIDLRTLLQRHGSRVSEDLGNAARMVQDLERLDERYLAFGQLQQHLMELIESIPTAELDATTQAMLAMTHTVQAAHAAWALQRAHDFATSRDVAASDAGSSHVSADEMSEVAAQPPEPGTIESPRLVPLEGLAVADEFAAGTQDSSPPAAAIAGEAATAPGGGDGDRG